MTRRALAIAVAASAAVATLTLAPSPVLAAEVRNGGFESGDHTGWTIESNQPGAEEWEVYDEAARPTYGPGVLAPVPPCGDHASWVDQGDPVGTVLLQEIVLEAGGTHELAFTHFYADVADDESPPTALDHVTGALDPASATTFHSPDSLVVDGGFPNQQYRVDVLREGADPFSVEDDDVLLEVFGTRPGDPGTAGPTDVTADLSGFAGRTVVLRFAMAVTENPLVVMLDCVRIASETGATTTTPGVEPASPTPTVTLAPVASPVPGIPAFTG